MSHIENISRLTLLSAEQRLPTLATMAVAFACSSRDLETVLAAVTLSGCHFNPTS